VKELTKADREKRNFMKGVTVLCDTREKQNSHILNTLDYWQVNHQNVKLPYGDYSFLIDELDFRLNYAIERKAGIAELWKNITTERDRFEKELHALKAMTGNPVLIIENVESRAYLKNYYIDDETAERQQRKIRDVGMRIDATLNSWECPNRFGLQVHCIRNKADTAVTMLSMMYYEYRNFHELIKPMQRE